MSNFITAIAIKDIGVENLDLISIDLENYRYRDLKINPIYWKAHKAYRNMMQRVKPDSSYRKKWTSYDGCTVCDEWANDIRTFIRWYLDNYYELDGDTVELDKDILVKGNKHYSPETCLLVPKKVNTAFAFSSKRSGNVLPKGVFQNKKTGKYYIHNVFKYIDEINESKKQITFDTVEEAYNAYVLHRQCQIRAMAEYYKKQIPEKVYRAMLNYWE